MAFYFKETIKFYPNLLNAVNQPVFAVN